MEDLYYLRPSRKRVPAEITFALSCKLQASVRKKKTNYASLFNFFRTKSCKFEKFVVILQKNLRNSIWQEDE